MHDFTADAVADELSKIARELRIANLLAYHATLDSKSTQAREVLKVVRRMVGDSK